MEPSIWKPDYDVVHRCETPSFQLAVASHATKVTGKIISRPHNLGVVQWELDDPGTRNEYYVRGNDFVERYYSEPGRLFTEIYHRILPTADGIEWIVSRHTHLLDSDPRLSIRVSFNNANSVSTMGADGQWSPPGFVEGNQTSLRERQAAVIGCLDAFQYGVFVYPGDSPELRVSRLNEESVEVGMTLFSEPLEKGVIRRCRWMIRQAGGADAMERLATEYVEFCRSKIPLTT